MNVRAVTESLRSIERNLHEGNQIAFDVFLRGKEIDTVFYSQSAKVDADEVKRALVNHDGYDPAIVVKRRGSRTDVAERSIDEVGPPLSKDPEVREMNALSATKEVTANAARLARNIHSGDAETAKLNMRDILNALQDVSDYPGLDDGGKIWDALDTAIKAAR